MPKGMPLRESSVPFGVRWKLLYPSRDGTPYVYVKVGAKSVEIQTGQYKYNVDFDQIEISQGTIVARRNMCVVLSLERQSE